MVNWNGRLPNIKQPFSNRAVWLAGGVCVLLIVAVIYGFKYRFQAKQAEKDNQRTIMVGSEPASSNRPSKEPSLVSPSTLGTPEGNTAAGTNSNPLKPVADAGKSAVAAIANPTGNTGSNSGLPVAWQNSPNTPQGNNPYPGAGMQPGVPQAQWEQPQQEAVDPVKAWEQQETLRRKQAAIRAKEAPTGVTEAQNNSPTVSSPMGAAPVNTIDTADADMSRLNAMLQQARQPQSQAEPSAESTRINVSHDQHNTTSYGAQNDQAGKLEFNKPPETETDDYLKTTRMPSISPWVIQRGTVIPAMLPDKLVTDLPGDLIATVTRDVFDSPTQKYVQIPAGSRLVGEYNSNVSYAQNRAQIGWTAIYFPDGSHVNLGKMPAHGSDGSVGLHDQTDNHYKRLIGGIALTSVHAAGLQLSQNRANQGSILNYPSTGQVIASSIGQSAAEAGSQLTQRNMQVQPTIRLRPGEPFAVFVNKDIIFSGPYEAMNGVKP